MTANEKTKEVLRRLTKLSKISSLSINELRIILALERIVARLEAHKMLRDSLIFKGGFVLLKALNSQRFTRDLDALALSIPKNEVNTLVADALSLDLDDGLYFGSPEFEFLVDQGQYGGTRIKIPFQIGPLPIELHKLKKLSRVHLDIGFGDVFSGPAKRLKMKPIIDEEEALSWKIYPMESIFAEKLETIVSRGSANSRGKDLYDLTILYPHIADPSSLRSAIEKTFTNRSAPLPISFADFFAGIDLTVLRNSWGAVDLQGGDISFDECIQSLEDVLRKVDKR